MMQHHLKMGHERGRGAQMSKVEVEVVDEAVVENIIKSLY